MEKYTKVRSIGEGAFGKALLVRDKRNNQQYVVKEIPMLRMKAKEREDARKEVSVLAQLHHPHIVTYRESFEEKGYLHIVMDFCEKGDLYHKISSQRGILFPEDQVMDWFVQITLAIKYVHDRKILHRDIKTQNIFLTASGTIQLGDFGIAKVLGSTVELARTCIGTPYYLSPEICENRPYNNKSDVWSLGCVLYELATLKHAFEAGNMKNLVLKIIRGSYPPISPKYSYDLRGLIAKLFKRMPKERPSVNSVLKMPFVQRRVPKFLTDEQIADEFSHTIMHGHKLGNKMKPPSPSPASRPPSANRPPSAGVRRPLPPKPAAAAAPKKYNPASIYGAPVARKSNDNRSSQGKRPGSGSGSRPSSSQDLARKKQEFIDREKKRRDEIQKAAIEKKHKDLIEKQKMNRMNRAREEGWKNVIGNLGSDESSNKDSSSESNQAQNRKPVPKPVEQKPQPGDRGDYADYHAYLDKLDRDRNNRQNAPGAAPYMAAPRQSPIPNWNRGAVPQRAPAATPVQLANQNRQLGADAAERARVVSEFIQRKKEAEMNKRRGNAELFGGAAPYESPRNVQHPPTPIRNDGRPSSADSRNREEQEYLERLKKIRQANYMERKNDKNSEAEARKKKIEALRQQADDRAKQLKEQLERQRREMMNKEDRMRADQVQRFGGNRPGSAPPPKPAPAVGITGVLKAIGSEPPQPDPVQSPPAIGMTGALKAIGAQESPEESRPKSALQLKREEVLKGVNQRGPPRGEWGAPADKPVLDIKEEEEPESSRSRWGDKIDDRLKELPLQETASAMEVTSARDRVIINPGDVAADQAADAASRRQWGRPGSTVMNALKEIPILEGGSTMSSDKSDESVPSSTSSGEPEPKPGIGETITLPKPPIHKGTITISSTEQKANITRPEIALKSPSSESPSVDQSKSEPTLASSEKEASQPEKSSSEGQINKPLTATKPVLNKPPLPSKPVPAEKPVVLPKPTILAKPESPLKSAKPDQAPKAINVVGEGSLFSKVKLETEENEEKTQAADKELVLEEIQDEIPKDKEGKPHSGMAIALTTGHFDIRNTGLLRTCSEPDLSKLSKVDPIKEERRSLDLELNKEDDLETEESPEESSPDKNQEDKTTEENSEDQNTEDNENADNEDENNDDEDIDDDEEDEDLMSVRETMASLLLREYSTDDDNKEDPGKFRLSMASSASKENDIDEENADDDENVGDDENEDKSPDGGEENGEADENGDENVDENGDEKNGDDNGDDNELNNYAEALEDAEFQDDSALFESDESDADTQFGDDDDNNDLFSRLEESRAELESELGCDKFLKVYKTVQALQEDEDENIEEGAKLAIKLLGKEQEHLYPKIFQLVMADAAFTEDNE